MLSLWDIDGALSELEPASVDSPTPLAIPETDSAQTTQDTPTVDESETIGEIVDLGNGAPYGVTDCEDSRSI